MMMLLIPLLLVDLLLMVIGSSGSSSGVPITNNMICSCCSNPVTDKGVYLNGTCFQVNAPDEVVAYNLKVYDQGLRQDIINYLRDHHYYTGPRYVQLGNGWLYDMVKRGTLFNAALITVKLALITRIDYLFYVFKEDRAFYPKHYAEVKTVYGSSSASSSSSSSSSHGGKEGRGDKEEEKPCSCDHWTKSRFIMNQ